jgi:hypothetical protein
MPAHRHGAALRVNAHKINLEIADYMLQHGAKFSDWYVSLTPTIADLFGAKRIPPHSHWIARETSDPETAEDVEAYFHSFGCDGRWVTANQSTTIVYAFLKQAR